MPYRYLENVAIADIAFEASGKSIEELLKCSWDATLNVMISDLDSIKKKVMRNIRLKNDKIDLLLFDFLQELIFLKDAERLLLRINSLCIEKEDDAFLLSAEASGEKIDSTRHELIVDVKAVTFHRFCVEKLQDGWQATVILDV